MWVAKDELSEKTKNQLSHRSDNSGPNFECRSFCPLVLVFTRVTYRTSSPNPSFSCYSSVLGHVEYYSPSKTETNPSRSLIFISTSVINITLRM